MPRPSQSNEKRRQLLPVVARTFAELGYRRVTTAELAKRCNVRENILYRLWPDKKAMFVAAIDYGNSAGCRTIALSGRDRGKLGPLAQLNIHVAEPHMGRIEDAHMAVCHMICYYFMEHELEA